jgi:hypothetical protein
MLNVCRRVALACLLALLGACASGPKYNDVKTAIPNIQPDQGRIYVYRASSPMGAAIQPAIMLNGEKIGQSVPGGFFFVDRPAGNYEIASSTEVEKKVTFVLEKGDTRYIKTSIGFGLFVGRVYPDLIDPKQGQSEIEGLSYIGPPLATGK